MWRKTGSVAFISQSALSFQSTPSVWRKTFQILRLDYFAFISIHSLRVEEDMVNSPNWHKAIQISIHSLRVEKDFFKIIFIAYCYYFNPLPPCGGRHKRSVLLNDVFRYFNPLPPCGGRLNQIRHKYRRQKISIHSLRVEEDELPKCHNLIYKMNFNPLPPCGGRLQALSRFFR